MSRGTEKSQLLKRKQSTHAYLILHLQAGESVRLNALKSKEKQKDGRQQGHFDVSVEIAHEMLALYEHLHSDLCFYLVLKLISW